MKIEAYGVKGMKSTPWRKTFKSLNALNIWAEANSAEVHATRNDSEGVEHPKHLIETVNASVVTF